MRFMQNSKQKPGSRMHALKNPQSENENAYKQIIIVKLIYLQRTIPLEGSRGCLQIYY